MHHIQLEIEKEALELVELEKENPSAVSTFLEMGTEEKEFEPVWWIGWFDAVLNKPACTCWTMEEQQRKEYLKGWAWYHSLGVPSMGEFSGEAFFKVVEHIRASFRGTHSSRYQPPVGTG